MATRFSAMAPIRRRNCGWWPHGRGERDQDLVLEIFGRRHDLRLPLLGQFQALNALAALGLAIATGVPAEAAIAALARLSGVPGRLQFVAETALGAPIVVDYAHTPDALAAVLAALRPHAAGRLVVLFGCGGDRDPGKRALMGRIAAEAADRVYVTDDNPRSENPAAIRRAILAAAPGSIEIGDRRDAIEVAIAGLGPGDLLSNRRQGPRDRTNRRRPDDPVRRRRNRPRDRRARPQPRLPAGRQMTPLWTGADAVRATGGTSTADWTATGVSIDSRTLAAGDLFVALRGPSHDGHDFVAAAFERGAAAAMVDREIPGLPAEAALLRVGDTLAALAALGGFARARSDARIVAVTGSVGKTGTKEALRLALGACAPAFASAGSLNNHWGVPLSLGPAAAQRGLRDLRARHEPPGRDRRAEPPGAAPHCADHHGRAGSSRLFRLARGDCRRQG